MFTVYEWFNDGLYPMGGKMISDSEPLEMCPCGEWFTIKDSEDDIHCVGCMMEWGSTGVFPEDKE